MAGAAAVLASFIILEASTALAQSVPTARNPHRAWQTAETPRWRVHYPPDAEAFASCLIPRLESMHDAVSGIVGWSPRRRITLLVDDPFASDGALASANARAPFITLFTQPSDPRFDDYSDCATMRMTHELTHIVHLAKPWGPGAMRTLFGILPAHPGPLVFRVPRWLREAYAEHVETVLLPESRLYTAYRPARIRALVEAGALPSYDALGESHEGRYIVGATFVDWLAAMHGDSSFAKLWRRMAGSNAPAFDDAFVEIFGARPDTLYARFTSDVAVRADAAKRRLNDDAGLVTGGFVRRLPWLASVALSPDGNSFAGAFGVPVSRLNIWLVGDSAAQPDRLPLGNGQPPHAPRFLRDGSGLLVVTWELAGTGVWRPDLYLWNLDDRSVRRVTRGAGIREADPLPDGSAAAATRCRFGVCDLVRVDLESGAVVVIARGSPSMAFRNPRVSPDGQTAAVTVQSGARSRIALVDLLTGALRYVDPEDGANRYDAAFLPAGNRLVVVSEASGIPNLEVIELGGSAPWPLTRVLTAALAPEPDPRGTAVYFILQKANDVEVRRVELDDGPERAVAMVDTALTPAVPAPLPSPLPSGVAMTGAFSPRPYGAGPRWLTAAPTVAASPEGIAGGLSFWSSDPIGRFSVLLEAMHGSDGTWRGGAIEAVWRGMSPLLIASLFSADHDPTLQSVRGLDSEAPDVVYHGGALATNVEVGPWRRRLRTRALITAGRLEPNRADAATRFAASLDHRLSLIQIGDPWYGAQTLTLLGSAGETGADTWGRILSSASLELGRTNRMRLFALEAMFGLSFGSVGSFERFNIGGISSPLVPQLALSQQLAMPLLPAGLAAGRSVATVRLDGPRIGPVTPFAWSGSAGAALASWHSLIGVERRLVDDGPRPSWRIPGVQIAGGVAYSLSRPLRKRLTGYVSLEYRN